MPMILTNRGLFDMTGCRLDVAKLSGRWRLIVEPIDRGEHGSVTTEVSMVLDHRPEVATVNVRALFELTIDAFAAGLLVADLRWLEDEQAAAYQAHLDEKHGLSDD